MSPFHTSALIALLACTSQAHATSLPLTLPTMIADIPSSERVLSVEHIGILITAAPALCAPEVTGWGTGSMCFDAVVPGGELRQFAAHSSPFGFGLPGIDGYTYDGPGVITVEYVRTVNHVSCMPTGPSGCHFHHYTLIAD